MKTDVLIVIPAREGSKRFPGKPMAQILGKSLLQRVWLTAQQVSPACPVLIATDSIAIQKHAQSFGADVILTRPECCNGSERTWEALKNHPFYSKKHPDRIINFQGDAVLMPPWIIQLVLEHMQKNPTFSIVTPAIALTPEKYKEFLETKFNGKPGGTLVVFDQQQRALYFSKAIIPFIRKNDPNAALPLFRHIGLYGYRYETLKRYSTLKPTPLEQIEGLEQLRALENGIPIHIVLADYKGRTHWSIDTQEDILKAESLLKKEGDWIL